MLAEFAEKSAASGPADDAGAEGEKPAPVRILCVPASDEADEVTAAMLALLLERSRCIVLPFTPEPNLSQLAFLDPAPADVICICGLPPFAFAQARTLSHRIRVCFPRIRMVVGVWGFSGEMEQALQRFQAPRPDRLVTSLADAIEAAMGPPANG
jgi:hypothetical protein